MQQKRISATADKIIKEQINIDGMQHALWLLARTILWPSATFSMMEVDNTNKALRSVLLNSTDPFKKYLEVCQQVILYNEYIEAYNIEVLTTPTHWLQSRNGYCLSELLFASLLKVRTCLPIYRLEIKALGEAVLELIEEPHIGTFRFWTQWFRE